MQRSFPATSDTIAGEKYRDANEEGLTSGTIAGGSHKDSDDMLGYETPTTGDLNDMVIHPSSLPRGQTPYSLSSAVYSHCAAARAASAKPNRASSVSNLAIGCMSTDYKVSMSLSRRTT